MMIKFYLRCQSAWRRLFSGLLFVPITYYYWWNWRIYVWI